MGLLIVLLLLILLFGGLGFASHLLWIIAVVALIVLAVRLLAGDRFTTRR